MNTKLLRSLAIVIVFLGLLFSLEMEQSAYAFQVEPLPEDNLIQNPWFRDSVAPTKPGYDSWVNVENNWTLSQKESNPSPDAFITGHCDLRNPAYCGTAAKLAADDGNARFGFDSFLYQIVPADPTHRKLKFFTHWVAHYVNPFEVNVYGGESPTGPWTLVWTPLYQEVLALLTPPPGNDTSWLWIEMTSGTPLVETILPHGNAYYKVEIHANLPDPAGFKMTGVYFASEFFEEPTPTPTPTTSPRHTPTNTETPTPTSTPPRDTRATPLPTNTETPFPTATATNTPILSPTATTRWKPTDTPNR